MMNFSPGGIAICMDTGASSCISNNKSDFIDIQPSSNTVLKGIGSGLHIEGIGTICWKFSNDNGDEIALHIHDSLYVPSTPMCLLSPQTIAQQTNHPLDGFHAKGSTGTFTFSGFHKTIFYNSKNNLPIFFTSPDLSNPLPYNPTLSSDITHASYLSKEPDQLQNNMTPLQHKLLLKHQQMGHHHMDKIQQLAKDGFFGASYKSISTCDPPLCKACIHGKQHKHPIIKSALQPLDSFHLAPGDCISGDQLESMQPGLIPTFKGSPTTSFYHAGTLLVDHASRLLHFMPHISTGAKEAIAAKHQFELFASGFNRQIKRYHADNGIFA
jgi:hypothetical protein